MLKVLFGFASFALLMLAQSIQPPVVIWHGLGDQFDNPGLIGLKEDLARRGIFAHIVQIEDEGNADSRATFFGNANDQVAQVCEQLGHVKEIVDSALNPSGKFDAIGFSQGGQLLRAVVERCGPFSSLSANTTTTLRAARNNTTPSLRVRNLITVGSQHLGISSLPPCPPNASPFSACRLSHLSIVKSGLYSNYAQHNIVPAQYFRDPKRIDEYLRGNVFLRDINNERIGDRQVSVAQDYYPLSLSGDQDDEARNEIYKSNFLSLDNLVMFRFSLEATVVPAHSAHFTLPSPNATNCPSPRNPLCYETPLPWSELPLYLEDYVGLKALDQRGSVKKDVCVGVHMQIDQECWEAIVSWLGDGRGERVRVSGKERFLIQL